MRGPALRPIHPKKEHLVKCFVGSRPRGADSAGGESVGAYVRGAFFSQRRKKMQLLPEKHLTAEEVHLQRMFANISAGLAARQRKVEAAALIKHFEFYNNSALLYVRLERLVDAYVMGYVQRDVLYDTLRKLLPFEDHVFGAMLEEGV